MIGNYWLIIVRCGIYIISKLDILVLEVIIGVIKMCIIYIKIKFSWFICEFFVLR